VVKSLRIATIILCGTAAGHLSAAEQNLSAKEVLAKVIATYSHVSAIHVAAKREETVSKAGNSGSLDSECELSIDGSHRFFARLKQNGQEACVVSDGESTWKSLTTRKEWTQLSATSATDDDTEGAGAAPQRDLHGVLTSTLLGQYLAIARQSEDPQFSHDEDVKVSGTKIPCYVIRSRIGTTDYELWVDKQRFLVLQYREKGQASGAQVDRRVKMTALEVNGRAPDSLFHFQPEKGWSEVEMLILPGEEHMLLTGTRAANFVLKALEGDTVGLDQTRGKVVVLDFWATWCPPCRAELPSIEKLRAEFGDSVQFYGVNNEDSGTVKSFVKKNGYDLMVLMDAKREVEKRYGVSAFPTLFIIDKQGVIREHLIGSRSEAALRKAIQSVTALN
jgi:thiol-disulfide isomerase/thioredoxin